jgi:hypothetical protein
MIELERCEREGSVSWPKAQPPRISSRRAHWTGPSEKTSAAPVSFWPLRLANLLTVCPFESCRVVLLLTADQRLPFHEHHTQIDPAPTCLFLRGLAKADWPESSTSHQRINSAPASSLNANNLLNPTSKSQTQRISRPKQ